MAWQHKVGSEAVQMDHNTECIVGQGSGSLQVLVRVGIRMALFLSELFAIIDAFPVLSTP